MRRVKQDAYPGHQAKKLGPLRPETDLKTGLAPWARPSQAGNSLGTVTNFAQPIILAYGTCASAKIAAIRSLCGRRWLRGTLVWRVRRCERASFMACGRSGRLTPKVYEARACAIDALFDVTPGESVGMLSALKGFGGCVGITFGWFGEGSSNVHHLIRFASQALADRCWVDWWASPEDAQAHFKAELFRDWGFAAARCPPPFSAR